MGVRPDPWYPVERKQKADELMLECDFLVFEQGGSSEEAVRLNFVNNRFETVLSYQLEQRQSVPYRNWPMIALAVLVDIPVVLITAPLVIVGYPFVLMQE